MRGRTVAKPGMTVRFETQTAQETITVPQMPVCHIAPLFEIVDPTDSAGAANANAQTTLPPFILGSVVGTTVTPDDTHKNLSIQTAGGVANLELEVSEDPDNPSYGLSIVADRITEDMAGLAAMTVNDGTQLLIYATSSGSGALLKLLATSNSAYNLLGLSDYEGITYRGTSSYANKQVRGRLLDLPVVHGDIEEMDIDEDSIRAWVSKSTGMTELKRDEAVLRHRYHGSKTELRRPYALANEAVDSFPQCRFAHNMRPKDDGDGDGQTDQLYARGTNAALTIMGEGTLSDYLVVEAWGDQLASSLGPYHGEVGNTINLTYKPSENTTDGRLVTAVGKAITVYPTLQVRVQAKNGGGAPTLITDADLITMVGSVIHHSIADGEYWKAKISTITLANAVSAYYDITLFALEVDAGGDPGIPAFRNMATGQETDNEGGAEWGLTATMDLVTDPEIMTTLSELESQLESYAANLVRVTAYGDDNDSEVVAPSLFDSVSLLLVAGADEIKVGDLLFEGNDPAAATWSGWVTDVDGSGPTIQFTAVSAIPAPADTFHRAGATDVLYTIAGHGKTFNSENPEYLTGGRDPINFAATGDALTAAAELCSAFQSASGTGNYLAALVRVENVSGDLPRRDALAVFGTSGAQGTVLESGSGYLILGFNPDGETKFPQDGETVTVTDVWGGTPVTATVVEFHTVLTTNAVGTAAIVAGDTIYINDGADEEDRSYVLSCTPAQLLAAGITIADVGTNVQNGLVPTWTGTITNLAGDDLTIRIVNGSTAAPAPADTFGKATPFNQVTIAALGVAAPDINEWSAEVVRATRIDGADDSNREYRLVVKNITRTMGASAITAGLPGGQTGAGVFGLSLESLAPVDFGDTIGTLLSHKFKTIPTAGTSFSLSLNGQPVDVVSLSGDEPTHGTYSVQAAINTAVGDTDFAATSSGFLLLNLANLDTTNARCWRSNAGGQESTILISGEGVPYVFGRGFIAPSMIEEIRVTHRAFDARYGFTDIAHFGMAYGPQAGDYLYDGATLLGIVAGVEDLDLGGQTFTGAKLVLDRDLSSTPISDYDDWYVRAKNLTQDTLPADYADVRPYPQFAVFENTQTFLLAHDALRMADGLPAPLDTGVLYMSWQGLRLDTSPLAENPSLISVGSYTELEANYGPVRPTNPLAWAMYLGLFNGKSNVAQLGISPDEVSDDMPSGTLGAHARIVEFLRSERVYVVALATTDRIVQDLYSVDVETLATPPDLEEENVDLYMQERLLVTAALPPTEEEPTTLVSGSAEGDGLVVTFAPTVDVRAALRAAGVDPTSTPTQFRAAGVYIDVAFDAKHYLVRSVGDSNDVTVTITHAPGANMDGFWSTEEPELAAGGVAASIMLRGAILETSKEVRDAAAALGEHFSFGRVVLCYAGQINTPYNGVGYMVDPIFLPAIWAAWTTAHKSRKPFTNLKCNGVTDVKRTNDSMDDSQLNRMAGGGLSIFIKPSKDGTDVTLRHSLSTDTSDDVSMYPSIMRQRDIGAWTLRDVIEPRMGTEELDNNFLASIAAVSQGVASALVSSGHWKPGSCFLGATFDPNRNNRVLVSMRLQYGRPGDYADVAIYL